MSLWPCISEFLYSDGMGVSPSLFTPHIFIWTLLSSGSTVSNWTDMLCAGRVEGHRPHVHPRSSWNRSKELGRWPSWERHADLRLSWNWSEVDSVCPVQYIEALYCSVFVLMLFGQSSQFLSRRKWCSEKRMFSRSEATIHTLCAFLL